jgi:hypothetical protein
VSELTQCVHELRSRESGHILRVRELSDDRDRDGDEDGDGGRERERQRQKCGTGKESRGQPTPTTSSANSAAALSPKQGQQPTFRYCGCDTAAAQSLRPEQREQPNNGGGRGLGLTTRCAL